MIKYKIEPDGLSYVIYRKRNVFSRWETVGRTMPSFNEYSVRKVNKEDFKEIRNNALHYLEQIKEMDKILIGRYK